MTTAMIKKVLKAFGQEGSVETELYVEIPGQFIVDGKWLSQLVYFTDTDKLQVYQIDTMGEGSFTDLSSLNMGEQFYIEACLEELVPQLVPKGWIEYNGRKFPYRDIAASRLNPESSGMVKLADTELWDEIMADYDAGLREAHDIDNSIFYYCDSGFIANDPTDEEIIESIKPYI